MTTTPPTDSTTEPATATPTYRPIGFQAIWQAGYRAPSNAYVVEPDPAYATSTRYIAVYVGGHGGLRLNIEDPAEAEQLAEVLVAVAAEFRGTAAMPKEGQDR